MRIVTQTRDGWLIELTEEEAEQLEQALCEAVPHGGMVWQMKTSEKIEVLANRHKRIPGRQP